MEVLVQLVLATVFKTVGPHGNHVAGGFDSHALPPLSYAASECWPLNLRDTRDYATLAILNRHSFAHVLPRLPDDCLG